MKNLRLHCLILLAENVLVQMYGPAVSTVPWCKLFSCFKVVLKSTDRARAWASGTVCLKNSVSN